jgi:hypothetical protein
VQCTQAFGPAGKQSNPARLSCSAVKPPAAALLAKNPIATNETILIVMLFIFMLFSFLFEWMMIEPLSSVSIYLLRLFVTGHFILKENYGRIVSP